MQLPRTTQPRLPLRRMHVEVDQIRVDLDKEKYHGVQPPRQELAVAVLDGLHEAEVGDAAAIEIDMDSQPVAARPFGPCHHRRNPHAVSGTVQGREIVRVQSRGGCRPLDG